MKLTCAVLLSIFFILTSLPSLAKSVKRSTESQVTLDLKRYMDLVELEKQESLTVIESVELKGSFAGKNLSLTVKGRSLGKKPKREFVSQFEARVKDCSGNGIVTLSNNTLEVVPLTNQFSVSCRVIPTKQNNFALSLNQVMYFESRISDAESIVKGGSADDMQIDILRKLKTRNQKEVPVVTTARYKVSVLPNSNSFFYTFVFQNSNRNTKKVDIDWANNESIERIQTDISYSESPGKLSLKLPPGQNYVQVSGRIGGAKFQPLFKEAHQFLLLDNHPMIQLKPKKQWRKVSVEQTEMASSYPSAKAYYINNNNPLEWESKKLEAFATLGFTVDQANYTYYVPGKGKPIVEASFNIQNQGTPEIPFKVPGKILYLEVNGQASPLYKDDKDQLLISMPTGQQKILLQYRPENKFSGVFNQGINEFVRPASTISTSALRFITDNKWATGFLNYSDKMRFFIKKSNIKAAFLLLLLGFIFIKVFKVSEKSLYSPILILSVATLFNTQILPITTFILILMGVVRYRKEMLSYFSKSTFLKVVGLGFAGLLVIGSLIVYNFLSNVIVTKSERIAQAPMESYQRGGGYGGSKEVRKKAKKGRMERNAPASAPLLAGAAFEEDMAFDDEGSGGNGDFQGLPARVQIPYGGKTVHLSTQLVEDKASLGIRFFIFNGLLIDLFMFGIFILTLYLIYSKRSQWKTALKMD